MDVAREGLGLANSGGGEQNDVVHVDEDEHSYLREREKGGVLLSKAPSL